MAGFSLQLAFVYNNNKKRMARACVFVSKTVCPRHFRFVMRIKEMLGAYLMGLVLFLK